LYADTKVHVYYSDLDLARYYFYYYMFVNHYFLSKYINLKGEELPRISIDLLEQSPVEI